MKDRSFYVSATRRSLVPLLLIGCSTALLAIFYALPFASWQTIDALLTHAQGFYPAERNEHYTYAYTEDDATLRIPAVGVGRFAATLGMAGPGGTTPVQASIVEGDRVLHIGTVQRERVVHMLVPSTARGDVQLALQSTTARLPNETRDLGILVNDVSITSLTPSAPPASSLLLLLCTLCIFWIGIARLPLSTAWRYGVLVCVGGVLSTGLALLRAYQEPSLPFVAGAGMVFTSAVVVGHVLRPNLRALWNIGAASDAAPSRNAQRSRLVTVFAVVTPIFIAWRIGLWLVAALALWFSQLVYRVGMMNVTWHRGELIDGRALWFAGGDDRLAFLRKVFVDGWLQWDGHRYVWIAVRGGYEFDVRQPNIAFFPLYPLLTRGMMVFTNGDPVVAAMLVSQLAMYVGLLLLYDLVATDFNARMGRRTILALLLFPTAVFLGAIYTESLAIALGVAVVWALRREHWWLAGAAGFFLALCRLPGVLVAPVIALTYLYHHRWRWRAMLRPTALSVAMPPLGLAVFMAYQWQVFGTPFAFLIAQQDWNNTTSPPWVLPLAMWRALSTSPNVPLEVLQLFTWAGFIGLTYLAARRLPLPYTLTMIFLLVPPYLSSWHRSFSRYVLPAFGAFVVIALLCERRWLRIGLLALTIPALIGATVLFVNGYWMG
jgi:hypothetical protein